LPIVLISGYSPKKLEDAMAENPSIRAVLKKPVTGRKLREALQEALADRSAAA
jgi:CheY-like chemotaxis protein